MKREQFDAMMEEVCENRKKLVEEREKELDEIGRASCRERV